MTSTRPTFLVPIPQPMTLLQFLSLYVVAVLGYKPDKNMDRSRANIIINAAYHESRPKNLHQPVYAVQDYLHTVYRLTASPVIGGRIPQ